MDFVRDNMVLLEEFLVWSSVGLATLIAGILSLRMYRNLPLSLYIYQCIALWNITAFGFCTFFGRAYDQAWIVQVAIIGLALGFQFYFMFFRVLFGEIRKYEWLQVILAIFFGALIIETLAYPPQLLETQIVLAPQIMYSMEGIAIGFFIISMDYAVFSIRKIITQHLSAKLSYFAITALGGVICALIPFIAYQEGYLPIYVPFSVQSLVVIIIMVHLLKLPYLNFMALIDPHFLGVMHKSGLTMYSYRFKEMGQESLFGGTMTAINSIFKETIAQEGFEQIHFQGKIIYCSYHPKFFVVYLDNTWMPFISQAIKEFTVLIAEKYNDALDPWTGDVDKFKSIEEDMRKVFYFLPQLIK